MTNLSARAEAGEDAAVLLIELFNQRHPRPIPGVTGEDEIVTYFRTQQHFYALLTIATSEAHLAAAMMLKGELLMDIVEGSNHSAVRLFGKSGPATGGVYGPTPAHALIAAIARSIDDGQ